MLNATSVATLLTGHAKTGSLPGEMYSYGLTIHDGYMWYCDDVGYICNFQPYLRACERSLSAAAAWDADLAQPRR